MWILTADRKNGFSHVKNTIAFKTIEIKKINFFFNSQEIVLDFKFFKVLGENNFKGTISSKIIRALEIIHVKRLKLKRFY